MEKVVIQRCAGYGVSLEENIRTAFSCCFGRMQDAIRPGDKVLLKPNLLLKDLAGSCVNTNPLFVRAVANIVKDAGGLPFVGDSPAFGTARQVAAGCGLLRLLEKEGIPVVSLKRNRRYGRNVRITRSIDDFDSIINLPKLKAHGQMLFTGAVKNLYGMVSGKVKAWRHLTARSSREKFSLMLLGICEQVRPCFTLVDAIDIMEKTGPRNGVLKNAGLIFAGINCISIDRVICEVFSVDAQKVPLLYAAQKYGFAGGRLSDIQIAGVPVSRVRRDDCIFPTVLDDISFSFSKVIKSIMRHVLTLSQQFKTERSQRGNTISGIEVQKAMKMPKNKNSDATPSSDFIRAVVAEDLKANKNNGRVVTRFPPEPNGYLHIGHAKSICLNFGIALENKGICNLRFDDTNPGKEEVEYVESIQADVRWLGFDWGDRLFFTSDYFERLHEYALQLIRHGKAYVCSLSAEEIRDYRGTLTEPGRQSPYRTRSIEENLDLFERMRAGEFEDGSHVLRAKIDMASGNLNMRDPVIYRILRATHHRTGNKWRIYPMYDFAHCLSDSMEGITHSICTLEFENNRPLYDWFLDELNCDCHPQQIEFARLNLGYTIMSKRKLMELVQQGHVTGWDDPRMPTLSGLRRRGYTPEAIRDFCERIGVARRESLVDIALLEHTLREDLNKRAPRVMAVLRPLRVVIENYPADRVEELDAVNNPEDPDMGSRKVSFSRVLYIEQDDFREEASKKFFRLAPGREVRLKDAYYVKCVDVVKDENTGEIIELRCTYDPQTRGGWSDDGRKVKGTLHWVSAAHSIEAELRLYDYLFTKPDPADQKDGDFTRFLNPNSLTVLASCRVEPGLKDAAPGSFYQFLRQGYFCVDCVDSSDARLVFNRTVSLRDSWAKIEKKQRKE
jgi:glutaminyl-tRNA synthetase